MQYASLDCPEMLPADSTTVKDMETEPTHPDEGHVCAEAGDVAEADGA